MLVVSYSCSTSNHNYKILCYSGFGVVSYSCSTSNHNQKRPTPYAQNVVSYSCSTSNHNWIYANAVRDCVVSYSCSTSNHNVSDWIFRICALYLIRVLHQTTTPATFVPSVAGCILFVFYIKPQHGERLYVYSIVVSYSCSTSNHNCSPAHL